MSKDTPVDESMEQVVRLEALHVASQVYRGSGVSIFTVLKAADEYASYIKTGKRTDHA